MPIQLMLISLGRDMKKVQQSERDHQKPQPIKKPEEICPTELLRQGPLNTSKMVIALILRTFHGVRRNNSVFIHIFTSALTDHGAGVGWRA